MSSADKRSVSTDALETLGTIIGEGEKRDAIHLAVEPIAAAEKLYPGQDVGIGPNGASATAPKLLGIVDPFLRAPVMKGERFWLVVYPRQIKSLRHVWEHPEFPASGETAALPSYGPDEKWIREWCATIPLDYEVVMQGAGDWIMSMKDGGFGEYLCFGGLLEGVSVPDQFWPHYEAVIGEKVPDEHRGSFFTCSC